jgi:DNA-binding transcriptional MerR regulator
MVRNYTTGQAAKMLRISGSTLKRWLDDPELVITDQRNYNGWRLFSEADIRAIREFKRRIKRNGKRFNDTTLIPVVENVTTDIRKQ